MNSICTDPIYSISKKVFGSYRFLIIPKCNASFKSIFQYITPGQFIRSNIKRIKFNTNSLITRSIKGVLTYFSRKRPERSTTECGNTRIIYTFLLSVVVRRKTPFAHIFPPPQRRVNFFSLTSLSPMSNFAFAILSSLSIAPKIFLMSSFV